VEDALDAHWEENMNRINIGPLHIAWEWGEESQQLGVPVRETETAALFGWPDWVAKEREGMRVKTTKNIRGINVPVEVGGVFGMLAFRKTAYRTEDGDAVFDSDPDALDGFAAWAEEQGRLAGGRALTVFDSYALTGRGIPSSPRGPD